MPTYTAKCATCGSVQDFYAKVAERDNTPECCGSSTARILVAAMIPAMGIGDHYKIVSGSGTFYGAGDYKKHMQKHDLIPSHEAKQEAAYQRAEHDKAQDRKIRREVTQIADSLGL